MTSNRRLVSSRENGKKSRGPQSALGRRKSSKNARRHGLAIPITQDPTFNLGIGTLSQKIAGDISEPTYLGLCQALAEAQSDIMRIRQARVDILADGNLRKFRPNRDRVSVLKMIFRRKLNTIAKMAVDPALPLHLQQALKFDLGLDAVYEFEETYEKMMNHVIPIEEGLGLIIGKLKALERYERRALSRRNKALRELDEYNLSKVMGASQKN